MELLVIILVVGVVLLLASNAGKSTPPRHRPSPPRAPTRTQRHEVPYDRKAIDPQREPREISGPAYVVDGDTIKVKKTQIRLFGIDAPELDHPFGKKAKWALVTLCKGKTVQARILETDVHGRTVARCTLSDGTDLSAEMVKLGLAIDWPKFSNGEYRHLEAPDARKKMWLADARQKGRMHVWEQYGAKKRAREGSSQSG